MRDVIGKFVFALGLIALWVWYSIQVEQTATTIADLEHTIIEQEKLIIEMENAPPVECISTRPYTYDQWVTDKPCPPGKRGPLCHMDESDYR